MSERSLLVAAAHYWAERGLTPMAAAGKHPVARGWQTLEPSEHLHRIAAEPPSQIALRMGWQTSGRMLIAIDVDGGQGERSLATLEAELGVLPATLEQRTGRGGRHFVFEWPQNQACHCPGNSASKFGPNVDIRGQGGLIIVAPSPHGNGRRYELTRDVEPVCLPPAWAERLMLTHSPRQVEAPPTGLYLGATSSRDASRRARAYVAKMDPAIEGSGGHLATWRVAQVLVRGFALSLQEAMEVMEEFNQRCRPPWSPRELTHKLESAQQRSGMPIGCLLREQVRQWRDAWDGEVAPEAAELGDERHAPSGTLAEANTPPGAGDWRSLLSMTRASRGQPPVPRRCIENVLTVLQHCPTWRNAARYNEFTDRVELIAPLPRAVAHAAATGDLGAWRDGHALWAIAWFHEQLGFEPSPEMMSGAILEVARQSPHHPVRDYLRGLRWDGHPRLDSMLPEIFGAADTPVNQAIGAKWMISAVARVFRPGCQVDHMMVLEGPQGSGKSTALRMLVGDEWFRNSPIDLRSKDAPMALRGCWVYEFDELESFRGREAARVKSFLTQRVDSYRPAYGRAVVDLPRECVFVGSTNEDQYLVDPSGNRRFWPVRCAAINLPALADSRAQLWAEAVARFEGGEAWHMNSVELVAGLREEQAEREQVDAWVELIRDWLERQTPSRRAAGVTTEEVLVEALEIKPGNITRRDQTRVGHALRALGLTRRRSMRERVRSYVYCPSEETSALPVPDLQHEGEAGCR